MKNQFSSANLAGSGAIALPAPARGWKEKETAGPAQAESAATALRAARNDAVRGQAWENAVWKILAVSALALIALSFASW